MEEKNRYFISRNSIYDYAMLLHLPQPDRQDCIGHNPYFVIATEVEALDIDTPLDFYIAEQSYTKLYIEHKNLLNR